MNTICNMGDYWLFSHFYRDEWVRFPFVKAEDLLMYLRDNGLYDRQRGNM